MEKIKTKNASKLTRGVRRPSCVCPSFGSNFLQCQIFKLESDSRKTIER